MLAAGKTLAGSQQDKAHKVATFPAQDPVLGLHDWRRVARATRDSRPPSRATPRSAAAARAYARVYLNVERGLWAWTMAARHHGEKFCRRSGRGEIGHLSEYLEESL